MAITEKIDLSALFPLGCIPNALISSDSGEEIVADKLQHIHRAVCTFDLAIGTTPPVAREEMVYVARTAGTINNVIATLDNTGTSGVSINFDFQKNGSSILTAVINFTHLDADRTVKLGTLSAASFVAGDTFSMELAGTMGTGAAGPIMQADFIETGTAV